MEALIESLSSDCDEAENQRRMSLKKYFPDNVSLRTLIIMLHRKLDKPLQELDYMIQQGSISAFFNNANQAGALLGFTKEIGDAITDYQVNLS
jgi:hypothetical protein